MAKKLNLGCGSNWKELYPGHVGLDIIDYGQDIVEDVLDYLQAESGGVYDEVMANHFLEHFDQDELRDIFDSVHHVLKPEGIFKFVVPHMKKERAYILSHKTYWNETVANWLGETEANETYGFGNWKVEEVITNAREDMHVKLRKI